MSSQPRAGRRFRLQDRDRKREELARLVQRMRKMKLVAWGLVPVVIAIAAVLFADQVEHRDDGDLPVVQGSVESVEKVRNWLVSRPELSIRIDGTGEVVRARLAVDGPDAFRDRVSFPYSGDPMREVRLVGESSPAWMAALLLLLGLVGAVAAPFVERHYRRQLQRLQEEHAADRPPDLTRQREG